MPSGGYRKPTNPAPVSGPGAQSKRTDGKQPVMSLPNAAYGEGKAYTEQEQGAAMAQSTPNPAAPSGAGTGGGPMGGMAAPNVVPFGAPSGRPGEEVTSGAAQGPGAGTDVMNFASERKSDLNGAAVALPFLRFMANQPGSSWAARNAVRDIQSQQTP